jgi:CDP-diglyceride synthetase
VADRYDDELAERRAGSGRPKRERGAGGAAATTGAGGGALPLQWADLPEEPEAEGDPSVVRAEEADDDADPGERPGEVVELGATIDLTGRATRGGADDLDAWSDVLRRRPAEAARLTGHPSAAGERIAARRRQPGPSGQSGQSGDDEFARAPLHNPRRQGGGPATGADAVAAPAEAGPGAGADDEPAAVGKVSRLRPVPPEPDQPGRSKGFGSDLATRIITGAVVAAGGLLVLNAGPGPAAVLVSLIVALGVIELCGALRTQGYRPAGLVALLGSVGLVLGAYHGGEAAFAATVAAVVPATLLWYLAGVTRARPAPGVASTFLAFGYVGVMGGFAGLILRLHDGVGLLLGLVLCAVAYDISGYLAGRRFGRRHIAPQISPNKTVEGLVAGMGGSVVVGFILVGAISPWGHFSALALGVLMAVMAPLGDLCESLLKRDLDVKDLGGLLPGHGGVLDRFDAMLFALPAVYYLIKLLGVA